MGAFSRFASSDGVKEDTGFHEDVLLYVWSKYREDIPDWGLLLTFHYFYLCYVFIHQYPRVRQFGRILHTKEFGSIDKKIFYSCVFRGVMASLAANMDEIKWCNRLHDFNHCPHFKENVSCIGTFNNEHPPLKYMTLFIFCAIMLAFVWLLVDSFPIIVYQPCNERMRNALYSGKYKATCMKVVASFDEAHKMIGCRLKSG